MTSEYIDKNYNCAEKIVLIKYHCFKKATLFSQQFWIDLMGKFNIPHYVTHIYNTCVF